MPLDPDSFVHDTDWTPCIRDDDDTDVVGEEPDNETTGDMVDASTMVAEAVAIVAVASDPRYKGLNFEGTKEQVYYRLAEQSYEGLRASRLTMNRKLKVVNKASSDARKAWWVKKKASQASQASRDALYRMLNAQPR